MIFASGLMVIVITLTGCASDSKKPVLSAVGPAPLQKVIDANATNGTLVVYSAYEVNADFNSRDPDRPECSDYKILTPDGKLLQRVHNNSGDQLQEPLPVPLPAGRYLVKARANGYGVVTVPVLIVARQNTVLHLEGGGAENKPDGKPTEGVYLPDGRMVGYAAPVN